MRRVSSPGSRDLSLLPPLAELAQGPSSRKREDSRKESLRENPVAFLLRSLETDELIGLGGFLVPHPERGIPMIGLLLIHRSWQRRGLGTEAAEAVVEYLGDGDWDRVAVTVLEACPGGREFWSRLGFQVVEQTRDQDKRAVWVMEAPLE